jgi:hypothetical protein
MRDGVIHGHAICPHVALTTEEHQHEGYDEYSGTSQDLDVFLHAQDDCKS